MKKFSYISHARIAFILGCFFYGVTYAQTSAPTIPSSNGKIVPIRINPQNRHPHSPSLQHIECIYSEGELFISFRLPEGECVLSITDNTNGMTYQYYFDSSEDASIWVGSLSSAHISISTANGHTYEGDLN